MGVTDPSRRVAHIDGLRGVAIMAVLLFHAGVWAGTDGAPKILTYGHLGVDLFFVVSGFCMVWPALQRGEERIDAPAFWRRRFLRVALPYWPVLPAALFALWLISIYGGPTWWVVPKANVFPIEQGFVADLALHAVLLHGLFPQFTYTIDASFWSLSTEWQFYIFFPALWLAGRRWGSLHMAVAGLVVAWSFAFVVEVTGAGVSRALLPWYLGTFCMGMLVAHVEHARERRTLLIAIGAAAAIVAAQVEWVGGPDQTLLRPLWALAFGAFVLVSSSGPLQRLLSQRVIWRIGVCSYSAYLIHGTIFMLMSVAISRFELSTAGRVAVYFLVGIPCVIALAWLYYRRLEEPAHRIARGRTASTLTRA
jgi:peptidoglycan/LPS O-acetylase OafA/YrhL